MKITNKILTKINESEDFDNQIQLLIDDELEAIDGYNKALTILVDTMTDSQYNKIKEVIFHIISEEKEHIQELTELKNNILK